MRNILVTGGAGFIGSMTSKYLKDINSNPIVLDNLVYGNLDILEKLNIPYYIGDIGDKKLVKSILTKHQIESVIHFSAFAYVGESVLDPLKYYHNNVAQTISLLDTLVEFGIRKFVFSSTCATYGIPKTIPISEDSEQSPVNPYGKSKLFVEKILFDLDKSHNFRSVILRYFNASGADPDLTLGEDHNPETHLIPLAIFNSIGRRDYLEIFGNNYDTKDGTCIRDYIHVYDLATAHSNALDFLFKENKTEVFNLGNGTGYSVLEIVKEVEEVSGKKIQIQYTNRREGDPPILIASSQKAEELLGWKKLYPDIHTIVKHAYQWHKLRHG